MQQVILWAGTAIVALAVTIPYFIRFHRNQQRAVKRRDEAHALGIDRARAQYPVVDMSMCIGCGSCVRSCPEHDVLAVVHGTAVVVNGMRCVGHGCCERACPIGALEVTLGDVSGRSDMPILTEFNETVVPGLFIAGELGGLSLIRNAINQARTVVEHIATISPARGSDDVLDLVIVGAGPAGLTAALSAINSKLSYVLLNESDLGGTIRHYPRRKLVMTQPVEIPLYGWLKKLEYSKEELLDIWQDVVTRHQVDIRNGERVESVRKAGNTFEVKTTYGFFRARNVVLAMGRRGTPRKLGVPGEESEKVMYSLTDAQSYTHNHILIVGGGDSAVEAAAGLAQQPGNTVTISYRKTGFFRIKKKNENLINHLISENKLRVIFESNVERIDVQSVRLIAPDQAIEIRNDYVFVFAGGIPPFAMLKEMGIAFGGESAPPPVSRPAATPASRASQTLGTPNLEAA